MEMIHSQRYLHRPIHRGERGAAVKPLRRECRMFRLTCTDLWALSFSAHKACGCGQRPAFPAPSALRERCLMDPPDANRAAGTRGHVPRCRPGQAKQSERRPGTHYHRTSLPEDWQPRVRRNDSGLWLWVPAPVRNCALGGGDGGICCLKIESTKTQMAGRSPAIA